MRPGSLSGIAVRPKLQCPFVQTETCRFSSATVGAFVYASEIKRHLKGFGPQRRVLDALEVGSQTSQV